MPHPVDLTGNHSPQLGVTQDAAFIAPTSIGGLGLHQPYGLSTAAYTFTMADDAIMDTADLDILVLFYLHEWSTSFAGLMSKGNFDSGNDWEWMYRLLNTTNIQFLASADGSTIPFLPSAYWAGYLSAQSWFAHRMFYDQSAGSVLQAAYEPLEVKRIIDANGGVDEVVSQLTPIVDTTPSGTPLTMINAGAPLSIGGFVSGAAHTGYQQWFTGIMRYAQVKFDGGPVTFNPDRDGYIGATSFTDADSGLSWVRQAVAAQTDQPLLSGLALVYDGGDFVKINNYTPTFTASTGAITVFVVITPDTSSDAFDRIVSTESGSVNGLLIDHSSPTTTCDFYVGGSSTSASQSRSVTNGTRTLLALIVDNGTLYAYEAATGKSAGTSITGVGTITHAPLMIGAQSYDTGRPPKAAIETVGVIERALSDTDLAALKSSFGI